MRTTIRISTKIEMFVARVLTTQELFFDYLVVTTLTTLQKIKPTVSHFWAYSVLITPESNYSYTTVTKEHFSDIRYNMIAQSLRITPSHAYVTTMCHAYSNNTI